MPRLIPDVMEGIMDIGPALGDWEEFEQGSILKATKQTGEDEWRCQRCDYSYDSKVQAIEHLRNSPNHILCLQCPNLPEFSTIRNLYMHLNLRHSLCLVCGVFFPSVQHFHDHMTSHPRCIKCQKHYMDRDELRQHYFNHSELRIKCPFRNCTFQAAYYTHMFRHLEDVTCRTRMNRLILDHCYKLWSKSTGQNFFVWMQQPSAVYGLAWRNYRCSGCLAIQPCLSHLAEHIELDKCPRVPEPHSTSLKFFWNYFCDTIRNFEEEYFEFP